MTPWIIIGWALIIGAVLYALRKWVIPWAILVYLHFRSRKVEPAKDQTWVFPMESGRPRVTVEHVNTEKGFVVFRRGTRHAYSTWSVDLTDWPAYMKSHLLIRVDDL